MLEDVLGEIERGWGSVRGFLREACGLGDEWLEELERKMLE